jgi:hypothetical protein
VQGYAEVRLDGPTLLLRPWTREQWAEFLRCFVVASARARGGASARRRGEADAKRLIDDVGRHDQVADLARTPLLATVLALVQRAGLRIPDHRVELYEQLTRILVERWNGLRSDGDPTPPLRAADAARLLGPVAVDLVGGPARGAITEDELLRSLRQSVEKGVSSFHSAEEALSLLRDALGLVVEAAPGQWAFLHLTLAEYLAAWQLLRTRRLEAIVRGPELWSGPWGETLCLACGIAGLLMADDDRLDALCGVLADRVAAMDGRSAGVGVALEICTGVLLDDPALTRGARERLCLALAAGPWKLAGDVWPVPVSSFRRELGPGARGPLLNALRRQTEGWSREEDAAFFRRYLLSTNLWNVLTWLGAGLGDLLGEERADAAVRAGNGAGMVGFRYPSRGHAPPVVFLVHLPPDLWERLRQVAPRWSVGVHWQGGGATDLGQPPVSRGPARTRWSAYRIPVPGQRSPPGSGPERLRLSLNLAPPGDGENSAGPTPALSPKGMVSHGVVAPRRPGPSVL